jgi:hypothetical protein
MTAEMASRRSEAGLYSLKTTVYSRRVDMLYVPHKNNENYRREQRQLYVVTVSPGIRDEIEWIH